MTGRLDLPASWVRFTGWRKDEEPTYCRAKVAVLDRSNQPALGTQTLNNSAQGAALLPTGHEVRPGWYATRIDDALVLDAAMFQREWRAACREHDADKQAAAMAAVDMTANVQSTTTENVESGSESKTAAVANAVGATADKAWTVVSDLPAPGIVKQAKTALFGTGDDQGTWKPPWVQCDRWPKHTFEVRTTVSCLVEVQQWRQSVC